MWHRAVSLLHRVLRETLAEEVMVPTSGFISLPRKRVVLASGSPRRRELLSMIGIEYEHVVPEIHETALAEADPSGFVVGLALKKAISVTDRFPDALILGADTVVVLDRRILGKPNDSSDAEKMLRALSGRTHTVYTGVALVDAQTGLEQTGVEKSSVTMKELTDAQIRSYIDTGEPMDKAGSYGIQGFGGVFIKHIKGCFFNVMGLPVAKLYDMLEELSAKLGR